VPGEDISIEQDNGPNGISLTRRKYVEAVVLSTCLLALYLTSRYNYLLFHSLAEIFSIVVATGVFVIALNADRFMRDSYFQVIGSAYLFIGSIDLIHTLSYKGMDIFQGYDADLPTQLWIAARYLETVSLLIAPFFIRRKLSISVVSACYAACVLVLVGSIFVWDVFPVCYIEGTGLTRFKIASEYVISAALLISAAIHVKRRWYFADVVLKLLIGSILVTVGSELAFTFYADTYDLSNLAGHFLKIISFYLMYKAVIENGIVNPFSLVFRSLKESEAALRMSEVRFRTIFQTSPDSISINRERDGRYVDVNEGFAQITGYSREEVIGRTTMDIGIWHDPKEGRRMVSVLRESGIVRNMEMTFRLKNGSLSTGLVSARSIELDGVPHILTMVRDIKEIKATATELERHQALLEEQVQHRTLALTDANVALSLEMSEREEAERALRRSERELKILSSQLMLAEEQERQRIARELHDSIGQTLSAIKFGLESTINRMQDAPDKSDIRALEEMVPITRNAIEEVRNIVMDLRPSILDDLGVLATIDWVCREFEATYRTIQVEKEIGISESDVPEPLKMVVFRILQEALNNVAKHSRASRVSIRCHRSGLKTELAIQDNGRGMDISSAVALKGTQGRFGLVGMRERSELAGASFDITSKPGSGTTIHIAWQTDH